MEKLFQELGIADIEDLYGSYGDCGLGQFSAFAKVLRWLLAGSSRQSIDSIINVASFMAQLNGTLFHSGRASHVNIQKTKILWPLEWCASVAVLEIEKDGDVNWRTERTVRRKTLSL